MEEECIQAETLVGFGQLPEKDAKMPMRCLFFYFLSLLNMPNIVEKFGSPRYYFEGKYLGGKNAKEVKSTNS